MAITILENEVFKCANCAGNLSYNPAERGMICPNCKTKSAIAHAKTFKKHLADNIVENLEEMKAWKGKKKLFKCNNCGADVELSGDSIARRCSHCDSPYVIDLKKLPSIKLDAVLPFLIDEKSVGEKFAKEIKNKFFAPRKLKKNRVPIDAEGLYISNYMFDSKTSTDYKATLAITYVTGTGKNRRYRTVIKNVGGHLDIPFEDVSVETSALIEEKKFNEIKPFNYDELVDPKKEYLLGYSVEHSSDDYITTKAKAHKMMDAAIKQAALSQHPQGAVRSYIAATNHDEEKFMYSLVPVYKLSYKYNKKQFTTYMNGQTGHISSGYPISLFKKIMIGFLIALGLVGMAFLFFFG